MGKSIIIVESPAKVKTIKKFLGSSYSVLASVGHIRDLPSNGLGIDEANDFAPEYVIIPKKQDIVEKLQKAAKKATVYLAPDPDREGEAIAWHIAELLKDTAVDIKRIQFNEITKKAITYALEHPTDLNKNLVDAQQARRILDRLVGYKISPLLWKKVKRGISAGRVQSVALRFIVDRDQERFIFVPEEYWNIKAHLFNSNKEEFVADLHKIHEKKASISSEEEALSVLEQIEGHPFIVSSIAQKKRAQKPQPPFITSTLQQVANQRLNYQAKKTMSAAQRLYEGVDLGEQGTVALITYMRTDSTRITGDAQKAALAFISETYGNDFLPKKAHAFKQKASAQDAHEAIRPIDVAITPESIKDYLAQDQYQIYKLIWQRFVASQMAEAQFNDTVVLIDCNTTVWHCKGEQLLFPGFLTVMSSADPDAKMLPKLKENEVLTIKEITKEQKFTLPPPLYTEASLIKELEEQGIGRPSTYATIISTLLDREYVVKKEKHFHSTELGSTVSTLLVKHFEKLMDVHFTANMELSLDEIALGGKEWIPLLHEFNTDFVQTLTIAGEKMENQQTKATDIICEECSSPMLIRFGKTGEFLACSQYPECKNTKNYSRDEKGAIVMEEKQNPVIVSVGKCPECDGDLVEKQARTGSRFIACSNYPTCKYTKSFSLGISCPQEACEGNLVEKTSKKGKLFYACSAYPKCTYALWDMPIDTPCPECSFPILTKKITRGNTKIICPECKYTENSE
ncbi:MAG: type I DNA topoisomerase [Desulfovibrionaceae bacterium]